jgi:hypothetical protein
VEPYHDRIRESVASSLDTDVRFEVHRELGETFARPQSFDAEAAAVHLAAAGERVRASRFAKDAAQAAAQKMAFTRTVELLDLALDLTPTDDTEARRDLTTARAHALANAGRGSEAAPLFLECATNAADPIQSADYRRSAVEQFLVSGLVDLGLPQMDVLVRDLKLQRPRHSLLLKLSLMIDVLRLVLRGPRVNTLAEPSREERLVLDTLVSIGKGFGSYDPLLGSWFFVRAARRALELGVDDLAIRGIAYFATLLGFGGS